MSETLTHRLNQLLPRLVSDEFLSGRGLGNEIAFYIFDYPPEEELQVREHIVFLLAQLPRYRPELRLKHVNLFDLILDYLKERKLLDRALIMQREKGDLALQKALTAPLHPGKLANVFAEFIRPDQHDLILLSGIGSSYPMLRSHSLLNNLQPVMGKTPLVMFFPGRYDGQSLRLFGILKDNNYYRAFKLVP